MVNYVIVFCSQDAQPPDPKIKKTEPDEGNIQLENKRLVIASVFSIQKKERKIIVL